NWSGNGHTNVSGALSDTIASLVPGDSVTYTVGASINPSATADLVNTVTVTAANDTNTGNNSASDTDTLTPQNDLSVTKTDGVTSVVEGSSDTYTIVVRNSGPSDVIGATVADLLPDIFTGASYTATATGGATGFTASGSGNISDTVNLP